MIMLYGIESSWFKYGDGTINFVADILMTFLTWNHLHDYEILQVG